MNNYASQEGGGLYYHSRIQLENFQDSDLKASQPKIISTLFSNNRARIGAATRTNGIEMWFSNTSFQNNTAELFGDDVVPNPEQIWLFFNNSVLQTEDGVIHFPFQITSGALSGNFLFQPVSQDGQIISILTEDEKESAVCNITLVDGQDSTAEIKGTTTVAWNQNYGGFLFEDISFYLNPSLG